MRSFLLVCPAPGGRYPDPGEMPARQGDRAIFPTAPESFAGSADDRP
jgi:hypothetical protein